MTSNYFVHLYKEDKSFASDRYLYLVKSLDIPDIFDIKYIKCLLEFLKKDRSRVVKIYKNSITDQVMSMKYLNYRNRIQVFDCAFAYIIDSVDKLEELCVLYDKKIERNLDDILDIMWLVVLIQI